MIYKKQLLVIWGDNVVDIFQIKDGALFCSPLDTEVPPDSPQLGNLTTDGDSVNIQCGGRSLTITHTELIYQYLIMRDYIQNSDVSIKDITISTES